MKTTLTILAAVIFVQSVAAQTRAQKQTVDNDRPPLLSKEFHEAGQLAYEAIERLGDYNDKPDISYEPRHLDAEKAVSEARRKAKTAEDRHIDEVLDNLLSDLDAQRQFASSDGRISNAVTLAQAYGEKSKQAIAANRRALEAQTEADVLAAKNLTKTCDNYEVGSQQLVDCNNAVLTKLRTMQADIAAGKSIVPLGTTQALDYWETAIFPCAVEASWYFGETLTKEGIEMAKNSACATESKPKRR